MPEISVVIPVYNAEAYLKKSLDGVLAQTMTDLEMICVDDCSKDRSSEIIAEYQQRYPKLVRGFRNEVNSGPGASRDLGLSKAQGKYVVFIDADDEIKPDFLERYYNRISESGADIVLGGYIRRCGEKDRIIRTVDSPCMRWLYPAVWMRMYRISFLREHHLCFGTYRMSEDGFFNYRCLLEGARTEVLAYAGYYYCCNAGSITRSTHGMDKYLDYLENAKDLVARYRDCRVYQDNYALVEYAMLTTWMSNLFVQCRHGGAAQADEMYQAFCQYFKVFFPDYRKNRYIRSRKRKEAPVKEHYATKVFLMAERIGLAKVLLHVLAK